MYNKDAKKGDVEEHLPDIALTIDRYPKVLKVLKSTQKYPK